MKINLTLIFFILLFLFESIQSEKILMKITKESDINLVKTIGPKRTFDLVANTKIFSIPNQSNEKDSNEFETFIKNF